MRDTQNSGPVHSVTKFQEHTVDKCGIGLSLVKVKCKISYHRNVKALSLGMANCHLPTIMFEP
jgi:hypothetical protein